MGVGCPAGAGQATGKFVPVGSAKADELGFFAIQFPEGVLGDGLSEYGLGLFNPVGLVGQYAVECLPVFKVDAAGLSVNAGIGQDVSPEGRRVDL